MTVSQPMTAADRRALLAECFPLMRRHEELTELLGDNTRIDRSELARTSEALRQLWTTYIDGLPIVPLSRCPFSRQLWEIPFDPWGIDGLWWNYDHPLRRDFIAPAPSQLDAGWDDWAGETSRVRPDSSAKGTHFHSFRGAVRPGNELPDAPFLVVPGPEKPFLITRLMELPGIRAVVSHIRLGNMDAYPIVYFAESPLPDDEHTNDWGTRSFSFVDERGMLHEGEGFDAEDMFEYDLAPWIERKQLLWIAPGDKALELREDLRDCPYLDLPGKQAVWRLRDGELWYGSEVVTRK